MVYLRSEEHLTRWLRCERLGAGGDADCDEDERALAGVVGVAARTGLASMRSAEQSQAILDASGLTGEFWQL